MKWLMLYVVVIVHAGLLPAVAYPALYWWHAGWPDSRVGRALMHKATALGGLFVVSVAQFWLPAHWLAYAYAVVVTAVTLSLYQQVWVMVGVFRERPPPEPAPLTDDPADDPATERYDP